jgi:hypothetical protein
MWFSQQLGMAGLRHLAVRQAVAEQLLSELPPGATQSTPLCQLLPSAQAFDEYRYALHNCYGLTLPLLSIPLTIPASPSLWERLTGQQLPKTLRWHTQTLAELIDRTVAANYETLLVLPLASQYEVAQVIIGITSVSSGVPVEEIRLQCSFTNDLGLD